MTENNETVSSLSRVLPAFRVYLCGPFHLERLEGDAFVPVDISEWKGRKASRTVFKALLGCPDRQARRDALLTLLWPDEDPYKTGQTLNKALGNFRKIFAETFLEEGARSNLFRFQDQEHIWVDADATQRLLVQAGQLRHSSPDALPLLEEAVSYLQRGMYLEDEEGLWLYERRKNFNEVTYNARLWLADAYVQRKLVGQAEMQWRALLMADPLDDNVWEIALTQLHQHGMTAKALRLYQQIEEHLKGEGEILSPKTQAFAERIRHEPVTHPFAQKVPDYQTFTENQPVTVAQVVSSEETPSIAIDWGKAPITRRLARLQSWVVDGLEDGTQLRWQLYYTSRNSLTENGLLSQIARLEQLADDGGDQHQRVCRILAQNYQLAGSVARDRFQYTKALEFFQKAEKLHEDTQLPDLTVTAIARRAVALLRKDPERYLDQSLTLYSSALDEAKHAEPHTQAYVLSHHAEALARKGDYDTCIRSLDQAEMLLSRAVNIPIEEDLAYVRLSLQSLADTRGECFVLLGKPEKGLEHLQTAQERLNQKMSRNNCRLLMQQSEAYLAAGQPDACVQQALKGLEVARALESTSNIHWADEILAKLRSSAFRQEPVVDELYQAIQG